jgi:pentatricopeptide repeat protein
VCKRLEPMKEIEVMYRKMFEACGDALMVDQVKDLYKEMQNQKYLDPDKVTYGTYYQALMKCKDAAETAQRQNINN